VTHPPRPRRLWALLACSAALLLSGCSPAEQQAAPGKAQEKPDAVAVTVPAADDAAARDWKSAAYRAVGCSTRAAWVSEGLPADAWDGAAVRTTSTDVTGDGTDEVLVQLTCPAAVSTPADHVVVFAGTGGEPTLLGVLGDDLFFPQADVTTDGATVSLSGPTVADDDPYCCPGHRGTVTYAWDGTRFVVASRSEVPGTRPVSDAWPADGEHVGVLLSVGDDVVTVLVVDFFEGADAAAACREDGVAGTGTAWCTEYYVRERDEEAVTLPVSPSASLSYLDLLTMETVAIDDVAALTGTYWVSEDPEGAGYSRFRTEAGVITELASVYTP
jgi:hypothetical protein